MAEEETDTEEEEEKKLGNSTENIQETSDNEEFDGCW